MYSCSKILGPNPEKSHSKTVSRATFPGRWPLTIDSGVLECLTESHDIVISSGDTEYLVAGTPRPQGGSMSPIDPIRAENPNSPGLKMDLSVLAAEGYELC